MVSQKDGWSGWPAKPPEISAEDTTLPAYAEAFTLIEGADPLANPDDPLAVVPPECRAPAGEPQALDLASLVPRIPPRDAVIAGVVDDGVSLGHDRFRLANQTTRFLAAWQQGALPRAGAAPGRDPAFGRMIYQAEIDALLAAHDQDEDTINRLSGVSDFTRRLGGRAVESGLAHGTHILDCMAGSDITEPDPAREKMPIIAVNLPSEAVRETSGRFLELFVIAGIRQILETADALWDMAYGGGAGYEIVLNLSLGVSAGPKNGRSGLDKALEQMLAARRAQGRKAPTVFIAAGNQNLSRTAAVMAVSEVEPWTGADPVARKDLVARADTAVLDWRLQPGDATPSFVEIWFDEQPVGTAPPQIAFALYEPCSDEFLMTDPVAWGGENDLVVGGQTLGRISARFLASDPLGAPVTRGRYWLLLSIAPTINNDHPTRFVTPGAWTMALRNLGTTPLAPWVYAQRDDTIGVGPDRGRQSYFGDGLYDIYDADGRLIEYDPQPISGPVRRSGTLNAFGSSAEVVTVGALNIRKNDPAPYSASGPGYRPAPPSAAGKEGPDYIAPSDLSDTHRGVLAAGSRSGSCRGLSGTSVSSAYAAGAHIRASLAAGAPQPPVIVPVDTPSVERSGAGRLQTGYVPRPVERVIS